MKSTKRKSAQGAAGGISILSGAEPVAPGNYSANTDGFVVGYVSFPAGQSNQLCITWIFGWNSDGVNVGALGGNVGMFNSDWNDWQSSNPQSFMFPVRSGTTWGTSVQNSSANEVNAPTSFWWIPIGTTSTGRTFEKSSGKQPKLKVATVSRARKGSGK